MSTIIPDSAISTYNIGSARQVGARVKTIGEYDANVHPLTRLMMMWKRDPILSYKITWWDDEWRNDRVTINNVGGYSDTDTDIVVTNANYAIVNDLVLVQASGELLLITAIDTGTNTWTVVREIGVDGSYGAKAAIAHQAELLIVGCAFAENSGSPSPRMTEPAERHNLQQIHKESVAESESSRLEPLWNEKNQARQRLIKRRRMLLRIEKTAWWGRKSTRFDADNMPQRTADGLFSVARTHVTSLAGITMNADELDEAIMYAADNADTDELFGFSSAKILTDVNSWGRDKINTSPGGTVFGVRIVEYINATVKVNLINHHLFRGAILNGYMALVPIENCYYCPKRDLRLEVGMEQNDTDGYKDQWLNESTFRFEKEKSFMILKGWA